MWFACIVKIVNSIPRKLNGRPVVQEFTIKTQIPSLEWFTYTKYLKIIIMLLPQQLEIFIYYISLIIIKLYIYIYIKKPSPYKHIIKLQFIALAVG